MCVSHYRRHLDGRGGRAASRTQKYAAVLCANTVGVVNGFIIKELKETITNVLNKSVEATNDEIDDLRATYHLDRAVLSCVDIQSSKTRGQPDSRLFNYRRLQTVSLVEVSMMFSRYILDYSHFHFSAFQRLIIYRGEELSEADDVLFGHQHNINYMRHREFPRVGEVGDDAADNDVSDNDDDDVDRDDDIVAPRPRRRAASIAENRRAAVAAAAAEDAKEEDEEDREEEREELRRKKISVAEKKKKEAAAVRAPAARGVQTRSRRALRSDPEPEDDDEEESYEDPFLKKPTRGITRGKLSALSQAKQKAAAAKRGRK